MRRFWARVLRSPSDHQRAQLYQELSGLTAAGIGIREALESLGERHTGGARRLLACLFEAVRKGETLAPAMAAAPELFSPLEAGLVRAGERTGRLDAAFRSAADAMERRKKLRNRILMAVAYPLFLVHFGLIVMPIGFVWVAHGFGAYLAFVVPVLLVLWTVFLGAVSLHGGLAGNPRYGRFVLRVPILGAAARAAALSRFARAFSALHGAGLDMTTTLVDAAHAGGNAWMVQEIERSAVRVREGQNLAQALMGNPALPAEVWNAVVSGEEAGELEEAMARTAGIYEEKFRVAATQVGGALFVLLLCLVGLVVAGAMWSVVSEWLGMLKSF